MSAFDDIYSVRRGDEDAAFLIKALQMQKDDRIIDLACGQGRHSIALARRGMNVVGVDASEPLLRIARQRARVADVHVSFMRKDMRRYRDKDRYDIALILGNSFGYFSDIDNEQVLSNVSVSVRSGGWLVLDLSNTPGMLRGKIIGEWTQKISDGKLTTRTISFNPATFQMAIQWRILQHKREALFDGMMRLYTPPEVNHLLAERNLVIKKTYGSFSNEPYTIKTKRYLVMAQKK